MNSLSFLKGLSTKEKYFYLLTAIVTLLSLYCNIHNLIFVGQIETYVPFTIPIGMNCNYYAILVGICTVFLLDAILYQNLSKAPTILAGIVLFYLILTLFLLTSRSAIIITFGVSLLYLLSYIKSTKKYFLLLAPVLSLGLAYLIFQNSRYGVGRLERFATSIKTLDYKQIFPKRHEVAKVSWEAISEKPWSGYGIEGAQTILMEKYLKYDYQHQYKYKYHSHNQYLQWGLYGGVGLIALLILVLLYPLIFTDNRLLSFGIITIFGFTFLTDAPLTDFRVLVAFLTSIFFLSIKPKLLFQDTNNG